MDWLTIYYYPHSIIIIDIMRCLGPFTIRSKLLSSMQLDSSKKKVFVPSWFIFFFILGSFSYLNFMVSTFPIHFPLNSLLYFLFQYFSILVENLILISVIDEHWTNDKWRRYWIFPLHRSPVKHKLILKVWTRIFIQRTKIEIFRSFSYIVFCIISNKYLDQGKVNDTRNVKLNLIAEKVKSWGSR